MSNSSVWPINRTVSGATTSGQSGPGSDGNEGALFFSQSSNITGASPSDCLMSYLGHSSRVGVYPSAEMKSVYSTAPNNWTERPPLHLGVVAVEKGAFWSPTTTVARLHKTHLDVQTLDGNTDFTKINNQPNRYNKYRIFNNQQKFYLK